MPRFALPVADAFMRRIVTPASAQAPEPGRNRMGEPGLPTRQLIQR